MQRDFIDIYCERIGPSLWAEPINALTNLAFIVSAILVVRLLMRGGPSTRGDWAPWSLAALIFAIGIGSGLFHTFAQGWAAAADVIPIAIFILLYTFLALYRFAGAPWWIATCGVAAVIGVAVGLPLLTGVGGAYTAALLAMLVIGGYLRFVRRHPAGLALLTAAAVFAVSLTLRTIDLPLCERFPTGTHFLWHLLNAVVLYLVARAMIRFGGRSQVKSRSSQSSPATSK